MKVVVGLDTEHYYRKGLDLLKSFKFSDLSATFVHAIEPVLPDTSYESFSMQNAIGEILRIRQETGEKLVAEATAEFGGGAQSVVDLGGAADLLTRTAANIGADLVVVGSEKKSVWGALFLGSVAKGVVIDSDISVLVGKQPAKGEGITAVLATDHSEYMKLCVDKLIALQPQGIKKIVVVTAVQHNANFIDALSKVTIENATELPDVMKNHLDKLGNDMVAKLRAISPVVEFRAVDGHPNDVIKAEMENANADVAIIGARGHGFIERTILGSISTHQVVAEPYNVLVLRH